MSTNRLSTVVMQFDIYCAAGQVCLLSGVYVSAVGQKASLKEGDSICVAEDTIQPFIFCYSAKGRKEFGASLEVEFSGLAAK